MPSALSVPRYTERVAHLPHNEENYIRHSNRGLPANSAVNAVPTIFQLRLITPRVTILRKENYLHLYYVFPPFPLLSASNVYLFFRAHLTYNIVRPLQSRLHPRLPS